MVIYKTKKQFDGAELSLISYILPIITKEWNLLPIGKIIDNKTSFRSRINWCSSLFGNDGNLYNFNKGWCVYRRNYVR
jgi:hypothetical protein